MTNQNGSGKKTRGVEAYELIVNMILDGELQPGEAIVESKLAQALGASRTPVREALFRLEQEGFTRSTSGAGFSVSPLSEREAREVYPLIAGLEVTAIEESGPLLPTIVDELTTLNEELAKAEDIAAAIQLDSMWHETLISCCSNRRLKTWINTLRHTIYRYEIYYMSNLALIAQSVRQHLKLIDLVREGHIDELGSELKRHYKFGMEAVVLKLATGAKPPSVKTKA